MRCRTLAREFRKNGEEVSFICRKQEGDLVQIIELEFEVIKLREKPMAEFKNLVGRELYETWVGCSQEQDADECISALIETNYTNIKLIVVDHYGLDAVWEKRMRAGVQNQKNIKLMAIDDLANRSHQTEWILDQNFYGKNTKARYTSLVQPRCKQLLGAQYALLGPEYEMLHKLVPNRKELRRILIYIGGNDVYNLTVRAIEALHHPTLEEIAVDVVIGQQSAQFEIVNRLVKERKNISVHKNLLSLAGLISRADLAIGACGATTWERICLKLPAISFVVAENQLELSKALEKILEAPWMSTNNETPIEEIREIIYKFKNKPKLLEKQSMSMNNMCDGLGASRVYAKICEDW